MELNREPRNIATHAVATKSLQSCLIMWDPKDSSPPGSAIPGILQAKTLEWVFISFSIAWKWKVKVKSLSRVQLVASPWTAAYQAPPSMGFSRQEYWNGLPLPSPIATHTWSIKSRDITLLIKVIESKLWFSSSHLWMWELDHKESWAPKNWCFWAVVLEKTFESSSDSKEIQSVNPKGNQSWIFIGRTDAEAETPIIWPPNVKSQLIRKHPDFGKDWRQEEKGTIEGCDSWMASPTWWTWVWASSGRWWRRRKPGVLQSMGSQRVGCSWATEQQQHGK